MVDLERTPATSAGLEQVEPEHDAQDTAGPTAAESPTPGDEGTATTAEPPAQPTTDAPTELAKRIALLTGDEAEEPPVAASTEQHPAEQAAHEAEADEPKADEAKEPPDLPEDVRKRMPREAAKAFASMRTTVRELRVQAEKNAADAPVAEFGRSLLDTLGDAFKDLQGLEDNEIREAIQERAAHKRGERPKATGIDPALMQKLNDALAEADGSLDLSEVRAILQTAASPEAIAKPAQPADAPAAKEATSEQHTTRETIQVMRTRNMLLSDGIQPQQLDAYVRGRLLPRVLADLKSAFPNRDPATTFNGLDAAERHQLIIDQHRYQEAQSQRQAPPKPPATRQRTPLTNGAAGRQPATGGVPASTNLSDRLAYLTDGA